MMMEVRKENFWNRFPDVTVEGLAKDSFNPEQKVFVMAMMFPSQSKTFFDQWRPKKKRSFGVRVCGIFRKVELGCLSKNAKKTRRLFGHNVHKVRGANTMQYNSTIQYNVSSTLQYITVHF
jgi:hypothetical protein